MDALLAFAAALLALRLAGGLAARWRARRRPELALWSLSLGAYALAAATLAWGAAAGWDARAFRAYYLFGGLLTAALLGAGSLALVGRRWATPVALVYLGLAVGVAVAVPIHGSFAGPGIPAAQDHLAFVPARLLAVLGNSLGVAAALGVAVATFRRRPLPNAAIVAGIAVAAIGTALGSLGVAGGAVAIAVAVLLLYVGFTGVPRPARRHPGPLHARSLRHEPD
ncbi:MAG TPA: hypothetical protein VH416_01585 [Gaiellaceae bacterium]